MVSTAITQEVRQQQAEKKLRPMKIHRRPARRQRPIDWNSSLWFATSSVVFVFLGSLLLLLYFFFVGCVSVGRAADCLYNDRETGNRKCNGSQGEGKKVIGRQSLHVCCIKAGTGCVFFYIEIYARVSGVESAYGGWAGGWVKVRFLYRRGAIRSLHSRTHTHTRFSSVLDYWIDSTPPRLSTERIGHSRPHLCFILMMNFL